MPLGGILVIRTIIAALYGAHFLHGWLLKRQQSRKISGRRAGWIYAAAASAPYLVFFLYSGIQNPGSIWVLVGAGFLIYSIQILPWVAAFRYPEDERRERQP